MALPELLARNLPENTKSCGFTTENDNMMYPAIPLGAKPHRFVLEARVENLLQIGVFFCFAIQYRSDTDPLWSRIPMGYGRDTDCFWPLIPTPFGQFYRRIMVSYTDSFWSVLPMGYG